MARKARSMLLERLGSSFVWAVAEFFDIAQNRCEVLVVITAIHPLDQRIQRGALRATPIGISRFRVVHPLPCPATVGAAARFDGA